MSSLTHGVARRTLTAAERYMSTAHSDIPIVWEPSERAKVVDATCFAQADLRNAILKDLAESGAVLLRGFRITSDHEFESLVCELFPQRCISNALLAEPGRNIVPGNQFVLYTNELYKTGGTLTPVGGFHTENYYIPDVPGVVAFYCHTPSRLGGETGLIDMAAMYDELPNSVREALEDQAFCVSQWTLTEIAQRYQLTQEHVFQFCRANGLLVEDGVVRIFKPSVVIHPVTERRALAINLEGELSSRGLGNELRYVFRADYQTPAWRWHRLYWIFRPVWHRLRLLARPRAVLRALLYRYGTAKDSLGIDHKRAGSAFNAVPIADIARLMRRHFASFKWRTGDVLLVDNLRMAHAGMPGSGARLLRALICDPQIVPLLPGPGIYRAAASYDTLGGRIQRWTKHHVEFPPTGPKVKKPAI
jgi:alpha-ketoglutarate-dependent taurine dioxygenase